MKTLKFLWLLTLGFVTVASGLFFSACFTPKQQTLIYSKYKEITKISISKAGGGVSYEITNEETKKDIFNKFSKIKLEKTKKSDSLLGKVSNQGTPKYYINIQTGKGENIKGYSFSVNIQLNHWGDVVEAYYLQRKVSERTLYYIETHEGNFNYFMNLYEQHKP